MGNYKFITENTYDNHPKPYLAIDSDRIETLQMCETYDSYGQEVGCYNSGCYSIDNSASDAKSDIIEFLLDRFKEIDFEDFDFNHIENEYLKKVVKQWREDHEIHPEVEGFNFWNGNNWETITTQDEYGETSHELIDDKELEDELNNAIDESEFVKEGFGRKIYETEKYWVIDNYCQGHFEAYEIYKKEDFELEEI